MTDQPGLRGLLPDDVPPDELERLGRVHELLLAAGRPAELPPHLAGVPAPRRSGLIAFAEHRRKAIVLAAAAAAAALFGFGFLSGWSTSDAGFKAAFGPVAMRGGGPTSEAIAQIWVGPKDSALNWPSLMKVRGLPTLPRGDFYALYLTDEKTGKRLLLCSVFAVHAGVTTVTFNFPGPAKGRGWVVVRERPGDAANDPAVLWTPQPRAGTA
jgi:hypothetical protein